MQPSADSQALRIVVLGYVVRGPLGGMAWHHLQYVLGLSQLGHDVLFIEDSEDWPACYDPTTDTVGVDPAYGLQFADAAFRGIGLPKHWAYYDSPARKWHGPADGRAVEFCKTADLVLNVSGVNPIRPWLMQAPVRALIDTDPVFTQVRHLHDANALARANDHNRYFTFGECFGRPETRMPADGFAWRPTRQPIVLDAWVVHDGPSTAPFTSVMQWQSYPPCQHEGIQYGMKSDSFAEFLPLPAHVEQAFELAVGGRAPLTRLQSYGWSTTDPLAVTRDPGTYQAYLHQSKGEFSVAKHGYVVSRCGWFSERGACYLASGRPVIAQDTGYSSLLPTGKGLLSFDSLASAVEAVRQVNANYRVHCAAARAIAEECFDSRRVLSTLIESAIADGPAPTPRSSDADAIDGNDVRQSAARAATAAGVRVRGSGPL